MIKFDILNHFTAKVLFTAEIDCAEDEARSIKLGLAVRCAIKAHTNLAFANLAGANLAGANLARAYLAGANLADADLADADLAGANLAFAYLASAYLARAYLAGAKNLNTDRSLDIKDHEVPVIPNIDATILAAIEGGGTLDMRSWHGDGGWCGTTHCRAGWAIHLAGEKGKALEDKVGSRIAGAMIYRASRPGKPAPWFFAPTDVALADIRKCAAEAGAAVGEVSRPGQHHAEP